MLAVGSKIRFAPFAADQGFEPQYHPPEGCVLPLDESAILFNLDILPQNLRKTIENKALLEYNHIMDQNQIKFRPKNLTIEDIKNGCVTLYGENHTETKLCMIQEEFRQGIDMISSFTPSVTFYGSAQLTEGNPSYDQARRLAYRISKELGYTILSGGGGGIMEAANRGAYEAGGKSVGLTIRLPNEQKTNKYVTDEVPFYFFFTRQVSMSYATEVVIFCPGGFGTLNELFEMLTLQQTNKIGRIPVILLGVEFWTPLQDVIKNILIDKYKTLESADLDLYVITDNEDDILHIITESRLRDAQDALK